MTRNANIGAYVDLHPSIHCTGSVRGMKKLGYWGKNDVCVRIGNYIYNLSITLMPSK
jgi:hypothetical protein